jgi:hypothetical protein
VRLEALLEIFALVDMVYQQAFQAEASFRGAIEQFRASRPKA